MVVVAAAATAVVVPRPHCSRQEIGARTDVSTANLGNVPIVMDELKTTKHPVPGSPTEGWSTHAWELLNWSRLIMERRAMP